MSQVGTMNLAAAVNGTNIRFFRDPISVATALLELGSKPQFLSFDAVYDADEKMVQKDRVTKLPNPYFGKGMKKYATTSVTVNFNYETKVENRGGEVGDGNWSTAIIVNGKPSPLSTHKSDVTVNGDGSYTFVENPRLYLRCEFVRTGDEENREDRTISSKSHYILPDGTEVDKKLIEPYLKDKGGMGKSKTDFKLPKISNITEIRCGGMIFRHTLPAVV